MIIIIILLLLLLEGNAGWQFMLSQSCKAACPTLPVTISLHCLSSVYAHPEQVVKLDKILTSSLSLMLFS